MDPRLLVLIGVAWLGEYLVYLFAPAILARMAFLPIGEDQRAVLPAEAVRALTKRAGEATYRGVPSETIALVRYRGPSTFEDDALVGWFVAEEGFAVVRLKTMFSRKPLAVARIAFEVVEQTVRTRAKYFPSFVFPTALIAISFPFWQLPGKVEGLFFVCLAVGLLSNVLLVRRRIGEAVDRTTSYFLGQLRRTGVSPLAPREEA